MLSRPGSENTHTPTHFMVEGDNMDGVENTDGVENMDQDWNMDERENMSEEQHETPLKAPSPKEPSPRVTSNLQRSNAFCIDPSTPKAGPSGQPKAKSDGRRNLFSSGKQATDGERLAVLQTSVSRVNIELFEVSRKLDTVLMNISSLRRQMLPNENRLRVPPNMPKLPLDNRDSLNKFETFLGDNDCNLAAVCDYMSNYIRSNVVDPERKSTNSILAKLVTNDLGKDMNLEGGNHKIAFRSLNLYKVFQGTLQTAFPDSDLEVAEDALKKWLKDAKWRKQRPDAA